MVGAMEMETLRNGHMYSTPPSRTGPYSTAISAREMGSEGSRSACEIRRRIAPEPGRCSFPRDSRSSARKVGFRFRSRKACSSNELDSASVPAARRNGTRLPVNPTAPLPTLPAQFVLCGIQKCQRENGPEHAPRPQSLVDFGCLRRSFFQGASTCSPSRYCTIFRVMRMAWTCAVRDIVRRRRLAFIMGNGLGRIKMWKLRDRLGHVGRRQPHDAALLGE